MLSSTVNQNNVSLTLAFADSSSRVIMIEDVPDESIYQIKNKVKAINANVSGAYNALYATFVSNEGDNFLEISNAKVTTIDEDVIYNG